MKPETWNMKRETNNLYAVIMAGGEGTRFYPLSTPECPKQFLNFIGEKSFIRQTFERILPLVSADKIYVSTAEKYVSLVKKHLPEISAENIIAEPLKKNTGPALVYATALIQKRHGNVVVCCLPSDHYIGDEEGFRNIVTQACGLANDDYLVTLGMKPSWPSTDYGYIKAVVSGQWSVVSNWSSVVGTNWYKVEKFTEKPKKEIAEEYIKKGYLWNGGIFAWRTDAFIKEIRRHAPDLELEGGLAQYFKSVPSISIDYAVMEKSDNVAIIPADIGWSDIGSWNSLEKLMREGVNIAPNVTAIIKGDRSTRCGPCEG